MTRIYLIRHAEAEGNIYRRAQGQYDSLVTTNGYLQLEALRARFHGEKIDAVYSSDLFRARETARVLAAPRGLSVRLKPELPK
jgi:probable phosphoglycerate mutase